MRWSFVQWFGLPTSLISFSLSQNFFTFYCHMGFLNQIITYEDAQWPKFDHRHKIWTQQLMCMTKIWSPANGKSIPTKFHKSNNKAGMLNDAKRMVRILQHPRRKKVHNHCISYNCGWVNTDWNLEAALCTRHPCVYMYLYAPKSVLFLKLKHGLRSL